jgi:formylglycine-generating enzyme required for sulfatase activity
VLIRLPAGTYQRGSPPDEPARDADEALCAVTIPDGVYVGETEVTVGQWERMMGVDFDAPERDLDLPIGDITWYDAQEFVRRLNEEGPRGWRLPSENEWEYACRAGTTTPFSFGEDIRPEQVNFDPYYPYRGVTGGEHSLGPKRVRSHAPNAWGFFDMHGNVAEWCQDPYETGNAPAPKGEGAPRVFRGGAWLSSADQVRSAWREGYPPKSDGPEYGFRVAWSSTVTTP